MYTLGDKYNYLTPQRAARVVMQRLSRYEPFIFHRSACRASVYIHFRKLPNNITHKLRVSDHPERERYGYKWQLRLDGMDQVTYKQGKLQYIFDNIDELVKRFDRYYGNVEKLNEELMRHAEDDFNGLSLSGTSTTIQGEP